MHLEQKGLIWSKWVLANGAGVLIGAVIATALIPVIALLITLFKTPDDQSFNIFFLLAAAAGGLMGAALGASQWIILRDVEQKIDARSWISATTLGTLLIWALILFPEIRSGPAGSASLYQSAELSDAQIVLAALTVGALFGAIMGTAQWVVLRKRFERSAWWIASSAFACALALPLMILALSRAEAQTSYESFWLIGTLSTVALGAMCGGVTGVALLRLRRRP